MLKQKIADDLKQAMLSGDKAKVELLGMLKSAILYKEVADGTRESGLSDDQIIDVLSKESKKRNEAAQMYKTAGDDDRANKELSEKQLIDGYLPEQMSDGDLEKLVSEVIEEVNPDGIKDMGKVIGAVKSRAGNLAEGSKIASFVKQKLS